MSIHRHRRQSSGSNAVVPATLEPGELAVQTVQRQLCVGDAEVSTTGAKLNLLTIRYFDDRAQYVQYDWVLYANNIYRARTTAGPGAWNATQWDLMWEQQTSKIQVSQAGHGYSAADIGKPMYFNGGMWSPARSNSADTLATGVLGAIPATDRITIQVSGYITGVAITSMVAGSIYYVDPDTAGQLTLVEPDKESGYSNPILQALSATTAVVLPWRAHEGTVGDSTDTYRRNLIINGRFDLWQRGTTQTGDVFGADDRWANKIAGGTTHTVTQQTFLPGQTAVPDNPVHYSHTVVSSGGAAGSYCFKQQRIEDATTLSGETAVLSFWARADVGGRDLAVDFEQYFGADGSSPVSNGVTSFVLTDDWVKYSAVVALSNVYGKTFGTDGKDSLRVRFWFNAGANYAAASGDVGLQSGQFDIAQVQFERGSTPTAYDTPLPGENLAACRRYYQKLKAEYDGRGGRWSTANQNALAACSGSFAVRMRTIPTVTTLTEPTYLNCSFHDFIVSKDSFGLRVVKNGSDGAFFASEGEWGFDAEL